MSNRPFPIRLRLRRLAAIAACLCIGLAPLAGEANGDSTGALKIGDAWSRATVGTMRPAVAYLTIKNGGTESDRLVAAETPVAGRAEMHQTRMENGVMRMLPVEAITVPAGGAVALEPGSFHLMLMDLTKPLAAGARFPLTLVFERAGRVTVQVKVEPLGGSGRKPGAGMKHMEHMGR